MDIRVLAIKKLACDGVFPFESAVEVTAQPSGFCPGQLTLFGKCHKWTWVMSVKSPIYNFK